jgi:hypothetical protein
MSQEEVINFALKFEDLSIDIHILLLLNKWDVNNAKYFSSARQNLIMQSSGSIQLKACSIVIPDFKAITHCCIIPRIYKLIHSVSSSAYPTM